MSLLIEPEVRNRFPDLKVLAGRVKGVRVGPSNPELEVFKAEVIERIRRRYTLESLKDNPTFRAYRDFFWRIKVDPTKNRPASEALIRRVLRGRPLPRINTLVDAYNLASMESEIAVAAFDMERLHGGLRMRFAREGEVFLGIGMKEPKTLRGGEVVISDGEKLVAIYPYRDAENSKITLKTRDVLLLACGVPGIPEEKLGRCIDLSIEFIVRFCGGRRVEL